jgi:hypothetical protein
MFVPPTDADSIQVDTSRMPSTTAWASPIAAPFRAAWEALWGQKQPPAEGCVVSARAWSGASVSSDVQIDWCVVALAGPSPP